MIQSLLEHNDIILQKMQFFLYMQHMIWNILNKILRTHYKGIAQISQDIEYTSQNFRIKQHFTRHTLRQFSLYGDVTITGEALHVYTVLMDIL